MRKWGVPFAVLALVILGLVFSGVLDGDGPAKGARSAAPPPAESVTTPPAGGFDFATSPAADSPAGARAADAGSSAPTTSPALAGGSGSIVGRVLDPSSAPIEGAVLHLIPDETPDGPGGRFPTFGGALPEIDAAEGRTLTDAEGRFRYEGLAADASFDLVVRAEGWVGQRRTGLRTGADPVEVVLSAGESVTGIVVDPAGRPVAGALVAAGPTVAEIGEGIVLSMGNSFEDETAVLPEVVTDAAGQFSLAGIPLGRFSVFASHERFSPSHAMNLMQGQEGITLELRPNTIVLGRVVDETGAPVAGATVRSMSGMLFGNAPRRGDAAETDERGAFRLEGLSPGQIHLIARAEDRPLRGTPEPVTIGEGETVTGVEIVLARAASITGIVVDPAGTPLAGATIRLRDHDGDGGRRGRPGTTSGADGSFVLPAVAPDPDAIEPLLHAHVEHPAHSEAESAPFTLRPGVDIDLGTIALVEAVTISGRVTTTEGAPIEGAEIHLVRGGSEQGSDEFAFEMVTASIAVGGDTPHIIHQGTPGGTTSDAEGNYRLRVREPGSYRVAARAAGHQRTESAEVAVGDRSVAGIDLELPPALRIEGLVVDELGLPCQGVSVRATAETRSESSGKTAEDGRFVVDGLTAGPHLLDLAGEGWSLAVDPPQVDAGASDVTLVARRPGRIAGRIVDASSGRPVTQFTVRSAPDLTRGGMFSLGFELGGVEYHDPEGRFILEGIAPGAHRITASAPGRVEGKITVEVASAATTEVTIPLDLAGIIVGRVVDTAGAPVEGATVTWERIDKEGEPGEEPVMADVAFAFTVGGSRGGTFSIRGVGPGPERTDEDGRFRLDGIADGEVRVKIRHDSFRERTEEPVRAREGEETDTGTLVLERGATLRGAVRSLGGGPLMWSNVRLTPASGGPQRTGDVGAEGAYEVGGLDAGEYGVVVEYMREPSGPTGEHEFVQPQVHDAGKVRLATDEVLPFDIGIPGG